MGFFDFFKRKKEKKKCQSAKPDTGIDKYIEATNMTKQDVYLLKTGMLVSEAQKWLYVREQGGFNCGPEVERFQREVDGKAVGEPWCLSFVMFCVNEVDRKFKELYGKDFFPNRLYQTEHCLTCWNKTKEGHLSEEDIHPGCIVIWQYYKLNFPTTSGHVGIVKEILSNGDIITIEGNTRDRSNVVREGDGVYQMRRRITRSGRMQVKGFLQCWDGYNR